MAASDATVGYVQCSPGSFQQGVTTTSCSLCTAGSYSDSHGAYVCTDCLAGTYSAAEGLTACSPCESGRAQSESGWSHCEDCEMGKYTSETTTKYTCALCEAGKTQPVNGSAACEPCSEGRFMNVTGSQQAECHTCQAGKVAASSGKQFCEECTSSVDFAANVGQITCEACPDHAQAYQRHQSCHCDPGFYAVPFGEDDVFRQLDEASYLIYEQNFVDSLPVDGFNPSEQLGFWCAKCPNGANCSLAGTQLSSVSAVDGFFMGLDQTGMTFFECFNPNACKSGQCAPGYQGLSCTKCTDDRILTDSFECSTCPPVGITIMFLAFFIGLFLSYLFYKVRSKRQGKASSLKSVFFKIIVSTFQINAIAYSYAFEWDGIMSGYLAAQGQISSLGLAYLEFSCLSSPPRQDFVLETVLYGIGPFLLVLAVFVGFFFHELCSSFMAAPLENKAGGACERAGKVAQETAIGATMIILFLLQPYLVTRFALLMNCVQMGEAATDLYLLEDLAVQCWASTRHVVYLITLGLPFFILYVVGTPYAVFWTLRREQKSGSLARIWEFMLSNDPASAAGGGSETSADADAGPAFDNLAKRADQQLPAEDSDPARTVAAVGSVDLEEKNRDFLNNYGFLFLGYREDMYFWEVIIMVCWSSPVPDMCISSSVLLFTFF